MRVPERYLRIRFALGDTGAEPGWFRCDTQQARNPSDLPACSLPNATLLMPGASRSERPRTDGRCIYCGGPEYTPGTGEPLHEEHVVAEGMGARLVLPGASCRQCEEVINIFESGVLHNTFWAARRALKIRGKRRKRKEEKLYPVTVSINGADVVLKTPLEVHPTVLFIATMDPPRLLVDEDDQGSGVSGVWHALLVPIETISSFGFGTFNSPFIDTVHFCQFLAKTAHAFAVAELGLDGFNPLLTNSIRSRFDQPLDWPDRYDYVGGDPRDFAPCDALHQLGWGFVSRDGRDFLVVLLRLFAYLGAPVFQVVVGDFTPEQKARARALAKARVRTSDRSHDPLS